MDFSRALEMLKDGEKIFREGWNGKNQVLELQRQNENSREMTLPYIFIKTVQKELIPWVASQTDLLAEDWETEPKEENQGPTPMKEKEAESEEEKDSAE